jgi:hypothetical protein
MADMNYVVETDAQVRYENEGVFMSVVFDAFRSHEISVIIGECRLLGPQKECRLIWRAF